MSTRFIVLLLALVLGLILFDLLSALLSSRRRLHCPRCNKDRLRKIDGYRVCHTPTGLAGCVSFYVCSSCSAFLRLLNRDEWSDLTELEQKCIIALEAGKRMERTLNKVMVPRLREHGFEGFVRRRADRVDFFGFETPLPPLPAPRPVAPNEEANYTATLIKALAEAYRFRVVLTQSLVPCGGRAASSEEVRLWHLEHHKPGRVPRTSKWFTYEQATTEEDCRRLAESVAPFLDEAERIFSDFEHVEQLEATGAGHGDVDLPDHSAPQASNERIDV